MGLLRHQLHNTSRLLTKTLRWRQQAMPIQNSQGESMPTQQLTINHIPYDGRQKPKQPQPLKRLEEVTGEPPCFLCHNNLESYCPIIETCDKLTSWALGEIKP